MVKEFKLHNGIRVIYDRMENLRTVSFGVWICCGSACETKKNNGISHLIEHMLFKGTKERSAGDIAALTARLGGNLNAYTGKEGTEVYLKTLSEDLPLAMDLISDMVKNSVVSEETLITEKLVVQDEIRMYDDSCEDMVHEKLQQHVWKNHPLGYIISGKKKRVGAFTREEILAFKNTYYTADRIVISAAGEFDEDAFREDLEKYFGDIPAGRYGNELTVPEYRRCEIRKFRDIEQVHLDIAFPCIASADEGRYAFSIANSIFGGSVSSRLFQKIREESGMAYSIYSYGSSFQKAGLWQIYAAAGSKKEEETIDAIRDVLKDYLKTGITKEELESAGRELRCELIMGNESSMSRMEQIAKSLIVYGRYISVDETIERLLKVTGDEVNEFGRQYLDLDKASTCIMGNCRE